MTRFALDADFAEKMSALSFENQGNVSLRLDEPSTGANFATAATPAVAKPAATTPSLPRNDFKLS